MRTDDPNKLAEEISKARRKKASSKPGQFFRALALVWGLGITMVIPLVAGWWLGSVLDRRWGTEYMMPLCMVLGIFIGGFGCYRLLRPFINEDNSD
ncbi:MAG: AtpZ/AtpI family protein [Chloroflexi bacterium]|nr:AtpZ/AtpI family protein [Chloroflexota bacterium]